MFERLLVTLTAAALLATVTADRTAAQEERTFRACYVPEVGAMYMIGLSGLPSECLSSEHEEISWTEGATAATDHGDLDGLGDDDHPEYVREGEEAGGDLGGTFPDPSVAGLQGNAVASTAPSDGQVLRWDGGDTRWEPQTSPSGVTDHGNLDGLGDDDHPEYVREGEEAGGDLDGTFPDPSVEALRGNALLATSPADGELLGWDGGADVWRPMSVNHGTLDGRSDDDHGQYLLADGVRFTLNGFAVTGTTSPAAEIPVEGSGTRLMWYPGSAAFRAGDVEGNEWDDTNVGTFSTAMGGNTTASGSASTAMGFGTTASTNSATAIGASTMASGPASTAMGRGTTASGVNATAMGNGSTARGTNSTALGNGSVADAEDATAMGSSTTAGGVRATAMGYLTTASGANATALGASTTASHTSTVAMGSNTIASGAAATAMGEHTKATARTSLVIGRNNVIEGSETTWTDDDPLFVAGNGGSVAARSNALELQKDGDLTIAGTLTESSDSRLKTGIEPLGSALEELGSIRPVRFHFREGTGHPTDAQIGLIAQEVREVFPELVTRDGEGYLSLAYPKLTAVLLRGLQEQQAEIEERDAVTDDLHKEIARLEAENGRMAHRLDRLESMIRQLQEEVEPSGIH